MLALKHISHSVFAILKNADVELGNRYTDFIYSGFYDTASTHIDWEEAMRHWSEPHYT